MKKMLKVLVFCFSFVMLACAEERFAKEEIIELGEEQPDQTSSFFSVIFVDSSFTKAKLNGDLARIYTQRAETWIDSNVRVEFYSKGSGARASLLTCDQARIDDKTKDMFAFGNVYVISDSTRTTLETSALEWNEIDQKLRSNEYVIINSPYEKIRGYGFESDQFLNNYVIYKVSGEEK